MKNVHNIRKRVENAKKSGLARFVVPYGSELHGSGIITVRNLKELAEVIINGRGEE